MQGIREANLGSRSRCVLSVVLTTFILFGTASQAFGQAIPQKNVNVIGPAPVNWLYSGNPRMQHNEADGIESSVYPGHLAFGFNDYRGVNDPAIGEAFPGIAMSRDGGKTWISGLHPGHYGDIPNLGQKGGADANLEYVPNLMFYNFIAFWRDGSQPGGIYVSRWYEHNREVGPPFEYLDTLTVNTGTSGKFLDKPAFKAALRNPDDFLPDIEVNIPAYTDPRNSANSHDAYVQNVPATRLHLCYSIFVGNDNNDGTKIECLASDNGGVTFDIKNKLSESVGINQGTTIATRNFGQEVLVAWTRFEDNNETAAIMYSLSTDYGNTFGKAKEITQFCPFNQSTGAARFRTNALPVAVSTDADFGVYIASRNDAAETCIIPAKGNKAAIPRMSAVDPIDDFDSFGETPNQDGSRNKDGMVRTSLNFSRIMMIRSTPTGNGLNWATPVMVDPQVDSQGRRKRGHQFMPACDAAGGIETCTWYDSRLDKLNLMTNPLPGGFVEDLVLHLEPGVEPSTQVSAVVLPAGIYDIVPPLPGQPPNTNNVPLRRNLDVFAAQIVNGNPRPYTVDPQTFYATVATDPSMQDNSPSIRVSRFATIQDPDGPPGTRKQAEWNYPNARLFRKGKASFIGDYNALFAMASRLRQDGKWTSNQSAPNPAVDLFSSLEPVFRAGWTSNHHVRGKVFYTGCDVWNETLQMWEAGAGCASTYTDPGRLMMIPLQGEDGTADGPPLTCTIASSMGLTPGPLTRNQNIYTAAMVPGISTHVVSAIKRPEGKRNTFVLNILNGSKVSRSVTLTLPGSSMVSFGIDSAGSIPSIPVIVPAGSGNTRTVFDFGNLDTNPGLADTVIVTVTDTGTGQILGKVPLLRSSLAPLENVQTNHADPDDLIDLAGDAGFEFYQLILKREIGLNTGTFAPTLDLENLDLENTSLMLDLENLDLENLDLENKIVFLDLENLDLENLDLENSLYSNLDLENLVINLDLENLDLENRLMYLDLENLDLENLDLENLDLENLDLENLDLENLDLENLDLENLDLENLDLENLDLENISIFAADVENLDLENLDLENIAPGDEYTEISWTADSANNTTTGVDIKPIFSLSTAEDLAASGATVMLTVRTSYLNSTVVEVPGQQYCAPQVVVDNQILYAATLSPEQIMQSAFLGTVNDPDPLQDDTPGFVISPDQSTIITLRIVNLPPEFDLEGLSANTGLALFSQPGGSIDCDIELAGVDVDPVCEVDFIEPDLDPPVITLNGNATVSIDQNQTYFDPGATAFDTVDGDISGTIVVNGLGFDTSVPGDYLITYDVTDQAGNPAAPVERTVTVIDRENPVITANGNLSVTVEAGSTYTDSGATASDNVDGDITGDIVVTGWNSDTSAPGSFSIYYNVTDAASNSAVQVTRSITVEDNVAPVITAPADVSVEATALDTTVAIGTATATDVVGISTITSDAPATFPVGTTIVTWTATDAAGNSASATQNVTVNDSTDPIITVAIGTATATDFVGISTITSDAPATFPVGTTIVTWTATDAAGNSASATQNVTVNDSTDPIITVPANLSVEATGPQTIVTIGVATATDLLGVSSITSDAPSTFPIGTTIVTWTALDNYGNSASATQSVTVTDTTDPTIAAPADVTAEATGLQTTVTIGTATATDLVGVNAITSDAPATFPVGTTTVTWTATDNYGNSASAIQSVTVTDTTNPAITIPADVSVEATGPQTAVAIGMATATDLVGVVSISSDAPATFPIGTKTVTWTATDAAGNSASDTQSVIVRDTTPAVITLIGNNPLTIEATASGYTEPGATAIDTVAGDLSLAIAVDASGINTSVVGSYVVTYTVSDGFNLTVATRNVTVTDTSDPSIIITDPPMFSPTGPFLLGPGENTFAISWPVSAQDLEAGLVISCSAGVPPVDFDPATTSYDDTTGTLTANFSYDFPAGSTSVTCAVTDQGGNTSSATFDVLVEDVPTITALATPFSVTTDDDGGTTATVFEADLLANLAVSDQIDADTDLTTSCLAGVSAEFAIGSHDVTCTVTDTSGNIAETTFVLEVAYRYDFFFDLPKGKIKAGSTLPVDFYYEDDGTRVDASAFSPSASWVGPYEKPGCVNEGADFSLGDGNDSGSSSFRWSASKLITQFSWQSPSIPGNYKFTISPPGTSASTVCVSLK